MYVLAILAISKAIQSIYIQILYISCFVPLPCIMFFSSIEQLNCFKLDN